MLGSESASPSLSPVATDPTNQATNVAQAHQNISQAKKLARLSGCQYEAVRLVVVVGCGCLCGLELLIATGLCYNRWSLTCCVSKAELGKQIEDCRVHITLDESTWSMQRRTWAGTGRVNMCKSKQTRAASLEIRSGPKVLPSWCKFAGAVVVKPSISHFFRVLRTYVPSTYLW